MLTFWDFYFIEDCNKVIHSNFKISIFIRCENTLRIDFDIVHFVAYVTDFFKVRG